MGYFNNGILEFLTENPKWQNPKHAIFVPFPAHFTHHFRSVSMLSHFGLGRWRLHASVEVAELQFETEPAGTSVQLRPYGRTSPWTPTRRTSASFLSLRTRVWSATGASAQSWTTRAALLSFPPSARRLLELAVDSLHMLLLLSLL